MRFDPRKSFGYPVLRPDSDDYVRSAFQLDIDFDLDKNDPSKFVVGFAFHCGVRELVEFVRNQNGAFWIRVSCRSTFVSSMYPVEQNGTITIDGTELRDVIEICGFVIARKQAIFESKKINEEFGCDSFEVSQGQIMAHSYPSSYVVEKDFWKPLQSIFEYRIGENLKEGEFFVELEATSGVVEIIAHSELIKQLNAFEKSQDGRNLLINSVFFPTVIQMITRIQESHESKESVLDKKWAKILLAKAAAKKVDIWNKKVALVAQQLLDFPLLKLASIQFEKSV
jgi:hypothetical protein